MVSGSINAYAYGKKSIERGEPILYIPQILRRRLVTAKQRWKLRTNIIVIKKNVFVILNQRDVFVMINGLRPSSFSILSINILPLVSYEQKKYMFFE